MHVTENVMQFVMYTVTCNEAILQKCSEKGKMAAALWRSQ